MTKKQERKGAEKLYLVLVGIESDALQQRYEPGSKPVNLDDWPPEVIQEWLAQGVLQEASPDESTR